MRSIFVKGAPIDTGLLIGVKQLKEFNHAVRVHSDPLLRRHAEVDLTVPNAICMLDHLVADALCSVTVQPTDTQFIEIAQNRYLEWEGDGYPKVDTPMIPLLNAIAKTNVLCPMHSCTGHVDAERNQTLGYVSITGEIHTLLYFEQVLVSLIKHMPEVKWLKLQRSSNFLPLGNTLFELPFISYPVIVIRWYGKTQELLDARRAQVTTLLEEACKDITAKRMD